MGDDVLDDLYNKFVLSASSILSQIDEFTLFCHYLGFQPVVHVAYLSPLRTDDTKNSFTIYETPTGRFRYRDFGTGEDGNVFKFISKLYGISHREVLELINEDFDLGYNGKIMTDRKKIIRAVPIIKPKATIRVTSKQAFSDEGLSFWGQFHITPKHLARYNVTEIKYIHYDGRIVTPRGLCFAYRIGEYYKIYQPYSTDFKFSNSYPRGYVEGFLQLKGKSDTLIITKSLKDVMCLDVIGFEAVSPKGENTPILPDILSKLEAKYSKIYTLFDNDEAGKLGAARYPYQQLYYTKSKDTSDHLRDHGILDTRLELTKLLYK